MKSKTNRRKKLENLIQTGSKLTQDQLVESIILMSFRDDGEPRDFVQKDLRELLMEYENFHEVFEEGFEA